MILLDPSARPIIGHRGASGDYPENTVVAFRRALDAGAEALELDVRLSADGVPVVIHDDTVERTTDGVGVVATATLASLRELDAGGGERIPTLAEVLETFPTTPLIVEIKAIPAGKPVAELLERHGAADRVVVGAFEHSALRPFSPSRFHRSASRRETARFWVRTRVGLGGKKGVPYRAFTVPERHGRLRVVDRKFARAARGIGRPVHVWTVDEPAEARRLWALGVAGIITNYPARLRRAVG